MELKHLRYFIAVAEKLNFTRAAEDLLMAQPHLSRQIQDLENEIGVELFVKGKKRPLELTAAGQVLYDEARLAVAQVDQARHLTQRAHRGEVGRLSVGFTSSIANSVLPNIVQTFRSRYPDIKLIWRELITYQQIQGLRDRQIDVGFFHLPSWAVEYDGLSFTTVLEEPLIVVLPSAHRLATESKIPMQALVHEEFVLPAHQMALGLSEQIYRLCEQAGFVPNIAQEASLMLTILGLVAGGVGVALLPANAQYLQRQGVVYRPIQGQTATVQMAAFWQRDNPSVILHNFIEVVRNTTQT